MRRMILDGRRCCVATDTLSGGERIVFQLQTFLPICLSVLFIAGCSSQNEADSAADNSAADTHPSSAVNSGSAESTTNPDPIADAANSATDTTESPAANVDSTAGVKTDDPENADVSKVDEAADAESASEESPEPEGTKLPKDLLSGNDVTPLNPKNTVLLDVKRKHVLVRAQVCQKRAMLEMLLCTKQTKEHESILSFEGDAQTIHAALLALGVPTGTTSSYDLDSDTYTPATGQTVDIFLHWVDTDGKQHREPAQNWVRTSHGRYYEEKFETLPDDLTLDPDGNLRYDDMNQVIFWYGPMNDEQRDECLKLSKDEKFQKMIRRVHAITQPEQMQTDWIFVGSGFAEGNGGEQIYQAEGGYVICVANFAMAMIDLAIESSASGSENLAYEAWTERIPPIGSEVLVELVPRPKKKTDKPVDEEPAASDKSDQPKKAAAASAAPEKAEDE